MSSFKTLKILTVSSMLEDLCGKKISERFVDLVSICVETKYTAIEQVGAMKYSSTYKSQEKQ